MMAEQQRKKFFEGIDSPDFSRDAQSTRYAACGKAFLR
jgi:hypothetical protein